jgi:hypothetical protein
MGLTARVRELAAAVREGWRSAGKTAAPAVEFGSPVESGASPQVLEVDGNLARGQVLALSRYELYYATAGLGVGFLCIVAGVFLCLSGAIGKTAWVVKVLGAESKLTDAAPGIVLAVVGFLLICVTRFTVKVKSK